ncbi:MAG: NTP transferase domain-containing protein [Clostridiaceae bacterium]|nr:NTP transferase domain-containing protein [Clostridiaceae bacterium]
MKAVIMAGGEGTRLRPLTCNMPKPMVPIVNKPVMAHIIELLKKHGFFEIAVTLQYMPDVIKDFFGNGEDLGVHLEYFIENVPLGTAGSVKNAEEFLDDTFIVISGDALTDANLKEAVDFHFKKGSVATLLIKKVDVPLEYGIVITDEEGRVTRFLEKPSWGEVFSDTVNTGIYILSPVVLGLFDKNEMFDFSKDLFPILLKKGFPMYGYIIEDYWCDIGDPEVYIQSHIDVLDGKVKVNIPGKEIREKVWVGEGTVIDDDVVIQAPCVIGKHTRIKKSSVIEKYSVVGDSNIIEGRTTIKRSILWKNCLIGNSAELRGSVVCNKVHMHSSSRAFENSIIGDDTTIKENAIIKPNIKIWPNKLIDEGTEVNSNLVWGAKYTKKIFGNRGVTGEINVDITPEYASKLGASCGAVLKDKKIVGVSCDNNPASKMIKMSFIAGLLTTGIEVRDFGEMLLPIARTAIRFYNTGGGIHIGTSRHDPERLYIDIMDENGCNIGRALERKIENVFIREDFLRCEGDCIKDVIPTSNYSDFYTGNIVNSVKSRKMNYKIVVNTTSQFVAGIIKNVLEQLGCMVEILNLRFVNTRTKRTSMASDNVNYFTSYVKLGNYDVGVSVEDFSEKMMLVDNKGRIITEDMYFALISIMLFRMIKGGTVVVPVSASHIIEKIAAEYNGKVLRTKTSTHDIMYKLLGNGQDEGMLDQFILHFDAIGGLVKILDFMSINKYKLSDMVDMVPVFHMDKKEVECPWNAKGKVIRHIMQEQPGKAIETLEGVKIYNDDGWVLILPDAELPICRVISESHSQEFAEELSTAYADKIRKISREK